jgi:hypothetical protein
MLIAEPNKSQSNKSLFFYATNFPLGAAIVTTRPGRKNIVHHKAETELKITLCERNKVIQPTSFIFFSCLFIILHVSASGPSSGITQISQEGSQ